MLKVLIGAAFQERSVFTLFELLCLFLRELARCLPAEIDIFDTGYVKNLPFYVVVESFSEMPSSGWDVTIW